MILNDINDIDDDFNVVYKNDTNNVYKNIEE